MSASSATSQLDRQTLSTAVKAEAKRLGFELAGIVPAVSPAGFADLKEWLGRGFAGEMEYMGRRIAAYEHPSHVLDPVRSIVVLAMNYRTADPKPAGPMQGLISRYAWGRTDYHDLIRGKLQRLAAFVHEQRIGCRTRIAVDTAPLLERDFARLAGLGWFGKNTMLINKQTGSWLFLAALLLDVELEYDQPHETAHCGTCTRCLDACPTDAFPEPYVLDARKCISYLTIELHQPISQELREDMGQWLFGCDICQDVCPWNRKAPVSDEAAFQPSDDLNSAEAVELLGMNDEQFHERFRHTALARPKRSGLLRNAAIVLGNSGDRRAVPALIRSLDDCEPLVRGAAAWALGRLGGADAMAALQSRLNVEDNADVEVELRVAVQAVRQRADSGR